MNKIYKILGKRGRITVPWELRGKLGFAFGDIISFEVADGGVIIRREKVCDKCVDSAPQDRIAALKEILGDLTPAEIRDSLVFLSVKWAEIQGGGDA